MEWILIWLGFAIATGVVGASKGRSGFGWFLLGLLFSFFALIVVACMPSRHGNSGTLPVHFPDAPTPDTHIKCPDCKELVLRDARVCKHCRCKLVPQLA